MQTLRPLRAVALALLLAPLPALACGPDSAKTHMGTLSGVDTGSGTFSIVDAETRQNLTFHATPELLQELAGASGMVSVRYESIGNALTAIDVRR